MTRVRRGTTINDDTIFSEKIINDIVAMDASFDPHQLPDLSIGILKTKNILMKFFINKYYFIV